MLKVKKLLGKRLVFSFPEAAWQVGPGVPHSLAYHAKVRESIFLIKSQSSCEHMSYLGTIRCTVGPPPSLNKVKRETTTVATVLPSSLGSTVCVSFLSGKSMSQDLFPGMPALETVFILPVLCRGPGPQGLQECLVLVLSLVLG